METVSGMDNLASMVEESPESRLLHVGRPNIGDIGAFLRRARAACETGRLSNDGPLLREFEQRLASYLGVQHCIAMANGTLAIQLVTRALELRGEVILPAFTFIATAHALLWEGIRPVFCDIDPRTHNIDPAAAARLITAETAAILGVHLWGRSCEVERLTDLAGAHGLKLLFDASHALGCTRGGVRIGRFGDAEIFSLHATKFINSIEGGMVATNNSELAEKLRSMRNFGLAGPDNVQALGVNAKMNEICAAMGLTNLEAAAHFAQTNRRNYRLYLEHLSDIDGIELIRFSPGEEQTYQYVVAAVDEQRLGVTRDELVEILDANGVFVRRYFYPGCHRCEPYRSLRTLSGRTLPHTDEIAAQVLCLPTGTEVTPDDIAAIAKIITLASRHRAVASRCDDMEAANCGPGLVGLCNDRNQALS